MQRQHLRPLNGTKLADLSGEPVAEQAEDFGRTDLRLRPAFPLDRAREELARFNFRHSAHSSDGDRRRGERL